MHLRTTFLCSLLLTLSLPALQVTQETIAGTWKLHQQKPTAAERYIEEQQALGKSSEYIAELTKRIDVLEGQLTRDPQIIEIEGNRMTVRKVEGSFRLPIKESKRFFLQGNAMVFENGGPKRLVKIGKTTMLHVIDAVPEKNLPQIRYLYKRVTVPTAKPAEAVEAERPAASPEPAASRVSLAPDPLPEPTPVAPVPEPIPPPAPDLADAPTPEPVAAPADLSLPPELEEFPVAASDAEPPAFDVPPAIVDEDPIDDLPEVEPDTLPTALPSLDQVPPEPQKLPPTEPAPETAEEREAAVRKIIATVAESEFPDDTGLHWEVIQYRERDGHSFVEVAPRPAVMSYDRFILVLSFERGMPKRPTATYAFEAGMYTLLATAPDVEEGEFPEILRQP